MAELSWVNEIHPAKSADGNAHFSITWEQWNGLRSLAGLKRHPEPKQPTLPETGWVIEGAWSSPGVPEYWCGSSLWSADHMSALRFAREIDAQRAAEMMHAGMNVRITEHMWSAL